MGHELDLIDQDKFAFLWVTNFPMFEYSEEEQRYVAAHHPFTSPNLEDIDKLKEDKANCYSRAYDLVLNGYELLSGSIRIHDQKLQEQVFEAIGLSKRRSKRAFWILLGSIPLWYTSTWRCWNWLGTFGHDPSRNGQYS